MDILNFPDTKISRKLKHVTGNVLNTNRKSYFKTINYPQFDIVVSSSVRSMSFVSLRNVKQMVFTLVSIPHQAIVSKKLAPFCHPIRNKTTTQTFVTRSHTGIPQATCVHFLYLIVLFGTLGRHISEFGRVVEPKYPWWDQASLIYDYCRSVPVGLVFLPHRNSATWPWCLVISCLSDLMSRDIRTIDTVSDWLIVNLGRVRVLIGSLNCLRSLWLVSFFGFGLSAINLKLPYSQNHHLCNNKCCCGFTCKIKLSVSSFFFPSYGRKQRLQSTKRRW